MRLQMFSSEQNYTCTAHKVNSSAAHYLLSYQSFLWLLLSFNVRWVRKQHTMNHSCDDNSTQSPVSFTAKKATDLVSDDNDSIQAVQFNDSLLHICYIHVLNTSNISQCPFEAAVAALLMCCSALLYPPTVLRHLYHIQALFHCKQRKPVSQTSHAECFQKHAT